MTDTAAPPSPPIQAAATLVLWRRQCGLAEVLMGQRGAGAVFMPSKFVFPGGRVETGEPEAPGHLAPLCHGRLMAAPVGPTPTPDQIASAALRELHEETGLRLSPGAPLRFFFRAITPPGPPRRFDARFLMAEAAQIQGDPQDFSAAEDELTALQWIPLNQAARLDLPFVTHVALAEIAHLVAGGSQPGVPFFDNSGPRPCFSRLHPVQG